MRQKRAEKKNQLWRQLLAVVLAVAMLPFAYVQPVKAATTDTTTVSIKVTYGQSEARKMLDEINKIRTDAGMSDLAVYDYGLEKCAMQRAAELALAYIGKRPDGRATDTIYDEVVPGFVGTNTEMVYGGAETTAKAVVEAWARSNMNAVMLGTDKYMGVSRVFYNSHYYWVVVCSNTPTDMLWTSAYDGDDIRSVSLLSAQISDRVISNCPTGILTLNVGEYYDLSKCSASIKVNTTQNIEYCPIVGAASATSDNPSIVSFNGSSLYAAAAGNANVTISCGGFTTASFQVVVQQPSISQATIDTIADQSYSGYELRPNLIVRLGSTLLVENVDYTVKYENNINIGTAYVTVTGYGKYVNTGSKSTYFRIVAPNVTNATVTTIQDQTYTGYAICPSVTVYVSNVVLREGVDYTVSYYNNVNIGTATVTITGIGSYSGTRTTTFRITGPNLYSATISTIPDQLYTGSYLQPTVTVTVNNITLRQGTDYNVSYSNNRNVGTATVTVTGRGSYSGTKTTTFRILGKDVSNATVNSISTQRYTGDEIRPSVTVKIGSVTLQQNVDYTLSYRDNTRPGTASITISGAGTYSGSKTVTFKIAQASLSKATVKVSDQTYDGEAQTPRVTVKLDGEELEEDIDFEVEYRNNKKLGKATAVITGIGDYSGTKKGYFVIKPKKVTWVSAKATTNSKGKAASLSWKKDSYASGYELYYSKKKSSGYKCLGTLKKNSYTKCTHNRRPVGTYYYKVRSYVLVDGIKCYGAYSSVKKVKIK